MQGKLIVITGLDGSGTSSIAKALCALDPNGHLMKTPGAPFKLCRDLMDDSVRLESPAAHYLFYLASVVHASSFLEQKLKTCNVYCVRYLIDSVVSHRVAGVNVELEYKSDLYAIVKPHHTFFVSTDESVRQDRITARGKSGLDFVLDDAVKRNRFLDEFQRYREHYEVIDNNSNGIEQAVKKAADFLPWLKDFHVK